MKIITSIKSLILLFICFMVFGCNHNNNNIPEAVQANYLALKEKLNAYLQSEEGTSGFGGEVYCASTLIGGNDNEFYLLFTCREYYLNNDSIAEGTGQNAPVIIKYRNAEILELKKPGMGSAYTHDINNMFPKDIANKILDHKFTSVLYDRMEVNLKALREPYLKKARNIRNSFDDIFKGKNIADFYAAGVEPFWTLYLTDGSLLLKNTAVVNKHSLLGKFNAETEHQELKFINNSKDTMSIYISKTPTFEAFSNAIYPYKVTVNYDKYTSLQGVGDTKPFE